MCRSQQNRLANLKDTVLQHKKELAVTDEVLLVTDIHSYVQSKRLKVIYHVL